MQKYGLKYWILIFIVLAGGICTASFVYFRFIRTTPVNPDMNGLIPFLNTECVIQSCHGLDVTCGPISPNLRCTMEYASGDICRKYVYCTAENNTCKTEFLPEFQQCKICVEKCLKIADPTSASQCEIDCIR